jgi:HK97 family phage major capsid protein
VDKAWAANTTTKAYSGLLSKVTTTVDSGAATLSNLDTFVSARFAAEANGAKLTHWVLDPSVAEALSNLKVASGSNQPLLQFVEDGITIAGLPVITTTDVDANTLSFGIDSTQQRLVIRSNATVEKFDSVTNDGQYLRGIMRVGWDTLNPAGIVRTWNATP